MEKNLYLVKRYDFLMNQNLSQKARVLGLNALDEEYQATKKVLEVGEELETPTIYNSGVDGVNLVKKDKVTHEKTV